MATASILRAIVTADTAQAQAKLAAVGKEVQTLGATGSNRLRAFGSAGKIAFGIAAVAAVKFAADSIASYRESEQVLSALQNVISHTPALVGETTAAFEKQATALQNLTGFQDEEILSADTVIARFGLTGDEIRKVIPLVLDYARATGKDVPDAASLVGKALLGNAKALKEIGIKYVSTGDSAKDLANIQQLLKEKVEGAAEAFGKTSQGKMEIFAAKMDDLKETIGAALLPVVDALVRGMPFLVDMFGSLPGPIQKVVVVAVAAGIAFVAFGLALNVVRKSLLGYTGQAAGAAVATEALAVAEGEAAVAGGAMAASQGGLLSKLGGVAGGLKSAVLGFGVYVAGAAAAAAVTYVVIKGFNDFHTSVSEAEARLRTFGTTAETSAADLATVTRAADIGYAGVNKYSSAVMFTDEHQKNAAASAAKYAGQEVSLAGKIDATTRSLLGNADATDAADAALMHMGFTIDGLANIKSMKGWQVTDAIMKAGRESLHSSDHVRTLRTQIVMLPNGKIIKITLPTLAEVRASLRSLKSQVEAIAGTYGITYVVSYRGFKEQRIATGGMVNMAPGGVTELTRPTRIGPRTTAGEGGREFVLPANPRGEMWIKDAVREGMSEGIAQMAGLMGGGHGHPIYMDGREVGAAQDHRAALRGVRS